MAEIFYCIIGSKGVACNAVDLAWGRSSLSLPAQYTDGVDFKGGIMNYKVCTVKFQAVKSYFSRDTTNTEVPSTRMDMEVW